LTAQEPDILLLDETIKVGDAQFAKNANKRMHDVVSRTSIVILASHSREYLRNMCSTLVWLEHGKVRAIGPTEEIMAAYEAVFPDSSRPIS
jgi:ABC-2 type transport system ATP-binding protein